MKVIYWAVFCASLFAVQEVLPKEVLPEELRAEVSKHKLVHMGGCDIPNLYYKGACAVFYDEPNDQLYVILADDGEHISHVVLVQRDKEPRIVWSKRTI